MELETAAVAMERVAMERVCPWNVLPADGRANRRALQKVREHGTTLRGGLSFECAATTDQWGPNRGGGAGGVGGGATRNRGTTCSWLRPARPGCDRHDLLRPARPGCTRNPPSAPRPPAPPPKSPLPGTTHATTDTLCKISTPGQDTRDDGHTTAGTPGARQQARTPLFLAPSLTGTGTGPVPGPVPPVPVPVPVPVVQLRDLQTYCTDDSTPIPWGGVGVLRVHVPCLVHEARAHMATLEV